MKTRGLKEARARLGNIDSIIENLLKKKNKIKIFESGCGYGRLMMDLAKKYGRKVDITGMNLKPEHGDKKIMIANAIKNKVITKKDLDAFNLPKIIYGDAGVKLPLKTSSIDLVVSQASTFYYPDKLHFFEEVARVLSKDGVARLTPCFYMDEFPDGFKEILRIYDKGEKIPVKSFLKKFKPIKLINLENGKLVVEIRKGKLNFKLTLETSINYNHLDKRWWGVQSIYYKK